MMTALFPSVFLCFYNIFEGFGFSESPLPVRHEMILVKRQRGKHEVAWEACHCLVFRV